MDNCVVSINIDSNLIDMQIYFFNKNLNETMF